MTFQTNVIAPNSQLFNRGSGRLCSVRSVQIYKNYAIFRILCEEVVIFRY